MEHERKTEIIRAAQLHSKGEASEFLSISLEDLREANQLLGNRDIDATFRRVISDRITELEGIAGRKHDSKVRATGYVVALVLVLIAFFLAKYYL